MASLYDAGWRQGSIVVMELPLDAVILGDSGGPERLSMPHGLWVVATQDCDLDRAESDDSNPGIELRPLFTQGCPADWGIRSAKLRLTDVEFVEANAPRLTVAPNVLMNAVLSGRAVRREVHVSRRQAFTTWLGLRYDRPAVPSSLVPLAQRISREVRNNRSEIHVQIRDILMQFDDTTDPVRYSLYAILVDSRDEGAVRAWLAEVSNAVPTHLGIAVRIEAAHADGIALSTMESSYSADVSQVTWRRDGQDPEGAT